MGKVAATNLPQAPVADVVAKPAPVVAVASDDMKQETPLPTPEAPSAPLPYAYHYAPQQGYYQAPVHPQTAYYAQHHGYYQTPAPIAVPVAAPANSQFHAQSESGEYNYGYANAESSKQEFKTADGIV